MAIQELINKKLDVEINKIIAQTAKNNKETRWYELVIMTGLIVSILAAGKYLL